MRAWLLVLFGMILSALIVSGIFYTQRLPIPQTSPSPSLLLNTPTGATAESPTPIPLLSPLPGSSADSSIPSPSPSPVVSNLNPDLTTDANGLSKATVIMSTHQGIIKFKFYPNDAPKTVHRIIELINAGFYNGLTFHRVVPGFVIQGGDPVGNGTGGSGQKLAPEFNGRRHVPGAMAMARAADPTSADSQFYISLGTHPHLDRQYTVFAQVIEGLDVAKKIQVGDKMETLVIQ